MVWCASIARMTRLAICTGCSFAPKSRALQPSIMRLTKPSTRSTRRSHLYHLCSDQDDRGRHVDPRQEARREREGAVGREPAEAACEEREGDLRGLPQHGRYQGGQAGGPRRDPRPRDELVDAEEEEVTREEAEQWRYEAE